MRQDQTAPRPTVRAGLLAVPMLLLGISSGHALSMKECSAKYQAAKQANTLSGQDWKAFRAAQCGSNATAGTSTAATPAVAPAPTTSAGVAATTPRPSAATPPASGSPVFPSVVSPKYASESAGKGRMHTCLDQYHANKASNENGGLKWIQKGGGYYSECSKHLKG